MEEQAAGNVRVDADAKAKRLKAQKGERSSLDWLKRNSVLVKKSGCRLWIKQEHASKPLVRFGDLRSPMTVQRAAWSIYNKQLAPATHMVTAKCGSNRCVEESHLVLVECLKARRKDATADSPISDRVPSGSDNHGAGVNTETNLSKLQALPKELQELEALVASATPTETTRTTYIRNLRGYFRWALATRQGNRWLSRAALQEYRDWRIAQGYAAGTVAVSLQPVRILAKELAYRGDLSMLEYQAIKDVKAPKGAGKRAHTWLSVEEIRQIFQDPPCISPLKRLQAQMQLMILGLTGLRVTEVAYLKWEDMTTVDNRPVFVTMAKGHKRVTVGIPPMLYESLQAYKTYMANLQGSEPAGDARLFDVLPSALRETVYKAGKRLQPPKHLAPHDLRRSFARLGHQAGATLDEVRQALGHRSVETTLRYIGGAIRFDKVPGDLLAAQLSGERSSPKEGEKQ